METLGLLSELRTGLRDVAGAADLFNRLHHLTGKNRWREEAEKTLSSCAGNYGWMGGVSETAAYALAVAAHYRNPLTVIVTGRGGRDYQAFLDAAARIAHWPAVVVPLDTKRDAKLIERMGYPTGEKPLAFVCSGEACVPPVYDPKDLSAAVQDLLGLSVNAD